MKMNVIVNYAKKKGATQDQVVGCSIHSVPRPRAPTRSWTYLAYMRSALRVWGKSVAVA